VFTIILGFTLIRIQSRKGIAVEEQSHLIASGPIGTPIAEYNAPDAIDYAEAIANDEIEIPEKSDGDFEKVL